MGKIIRGQKELARVAGKRKYLFAKREKNHPSIPVGSAPSTSPLPAVPHPLTLPSSRSARSVLNRIRSMFDRREMLSNFGKVRNYIFFAMELLFMATACNFSIKKNSA